MANEFVARNGIIAKADSSITGTLAVSGNISSGGNTVATQAWVTATALSGFATESYVTTAISNLVDAAPGTLNTLNELAAALGDDPNFATTVTNSIATKLPLAGGSMTGNIVFPATAGRGIYFGGETSGASYGFVREISDGQIEFGSDDSIKFYETDAMTLRADWSMNSGTFNFIGTISQSGANVATQAWVGTQGFLTEEADPLFLASAAYNIDQASIDKWNTAFGWGDHSGLYAAASHTHSATDITSGTLASARLSGTYAINISGNAATATSATDSTKLPLAGGTMTGVIDNGTSNTTGYRFGGRSFSWNSAMQTPASNVPHIMQSTYGGWDPVIGIKTTSGFWQMGAYSGDEIHFGYMAGAFGSHSTNSFDSSYSVTPSTFKIGNLGTMHLTVSGNITATGTLTASGYNKANWDTAYGWGDHAGLYGSAGDTAKGVEAFGWGDHAAAGYLTSYSESDTLATVTARGNTTNGSINVNGDILLTGTATTTNQGRMIDFTGFDKEGTTDFSDRAYIQHTVNTGGHSGSVLVISSQNDSGDGIAFLTNASSKLKHNSNNIATENWVGAQGYLTSLPAHTHPISEIDGLQDELDGKQPAGSYLTSYTETDTLASVIGRGNTATAAIFTGDASSRVLYLRGTGNIIQFQDAAAVNKWEIVGRQGTFYIYKGDGTGSGYKYQIDTNGNHTITGDVTVTGGFSASGYNKTNWDAAYSWGDHAGLYGSAGDTAKGVEAFGWGNHAGLYAAASHTHAYLPLSGGTLTGQVIFPSAATTKPVLSNGFISRNDLDDTTGRHDIWGISERYYPSSPTASDAWGIQWSGTPNDIVFVGAGTDRVTISLDEGNITTLGTVTASGGNSGNWNTAYSWGNHATAGYITDGNTNWNNTYGFITASSTDTLTNKSGNISQWTNNSGYITASDSITGTSAGVVRTVSGTSSAELVRGNMGDNDQARILVGATASNAGYLEIATADDGTEPIYVRQYTGVFSSLTRTATLLDGSGNTSFPGTVTASFSGSLSGNASTASKWSSARTITLGGDLTGNVSIDGSANVTLTAAVVDDSHTHDGRYYTESESDARFVNVTGDTVTGNLAVSGASLSVTSTAAGSEAFYVDGVNGRLFTISDDLSDSLFSVNTISGLPVIEAFADNTVKIGPFSNPVTVDSSGVLAIGGVTAATQTYVDNAISGLIGGAPGALDTLNELAAAINDDASYASTITTALGTKAPLASPALTGTPTAPTAAAATNNTQIATTAFVKSQGYLTSLGFNYGTGVTANYVVQRDANGYIYANYVNLAISETENPTVNSFIVSNGDGWTRKASVAHIKSTLGLGSAAYTASTDYAPASHNHTSLTGVTSIGFSAQSSDAASITTTISGTSTFFDFNLTDDNNNDWWRWRFTPSGSTVYDAMILKPVSNGNADLTVSGSVFADNLAISNWNTAYGWGDHSTAGYGSAGDTAKGLEAFGWGNHANAGYLTSVTAHTHSITDISDRTRLFNNMGSNHSTYQNFNDVSNFGPFFIQNTAGGPGTGSSQFYGLALGLGNDYAYGSYAMQMAIPRYEETDKYLTFRTREGGTWSGWVKFSAGYADSAGSASTATSATSAATWTTARTITIGNTGKSVNGSGNVSWSLAEIGAAAASHTHSYLPLSGGTLTGTLTTTDIASSGDRLYNIGAPDNRYRIVFCETLDSAGLHESNLASDTTGFHATGTVLVWKDGEAVPCSKEADHMKIGIAVFGNSSPLVQGAEPVLVSGDVSEGDYLITSEIVGHAKAVSRSYVIENQLLDCVIGKALETASGESHLVKTWVTI